MNFSKYQRTISLTLLILLGIGSTLPAAEAGVLADTLAKQGPNQEVLLAQIRRRRKPLKFSNLNVKAPTDRKSRFGAMRGSSCQNNLSTTEKNVKKDFIPLLPPDSEQGESQKVDKNSVNDKIQLTTSPHPIVLFYLPANSPTTATFYLSIQKSKTENENVYEARNLVLPNKTSKNAGGVVVLNLANAAKTQKLPELKVGENYIWQVALSCESNDSKVSNSDKNTPTMSGWIRRIDDKSPLSPQLEASTTNKNRDLVIADELDKVEPIDRPQVYANNGIWYSAINSLAELIISNPQDSQIKKDWEQLLNSVNLTEIAREPIIGSVEIKKVEVSNE